MGLQCQESEEVHANRERSLAKSDMSYEEEANEALYEQIDETRLALDGLQADLQLAREKLDHMRREAAMLLDKQAELARVKD